MDWPCVCGSRMARVDCICGGDDGYFEPRQPQPCPGCAEPCGQCDQDALD